MDGFIAMLPEPFQKLSSHMDFPGQQAAERTFQVILVVSGIIGFFVGYSTQQLSHAIYIVLGGALLSSFLVVPPWPFLFRKNPIQWQPVNKGQSANVSENKKQEKSAEKENKKQETKKTK